MSEPGLEVGTWDLWLCFSGPTTELLLLCLIKQLYQRYIQCNRIENIFLPELTLQFQEPAYLSFDGCKREKERKIRYSLRILNTDIFSKATQLLRLVI
jgi:hypothetical protein